MRPPTVVITIQLFICTWYHEYLGTKERNVFRDIDTLNIYEQSSILSQHESSETEYLNSSFL